MQIPDITIHEYNQLARAVGDVIKKVFFKPDDYDPYDEAKNRLDPTEDTDRYESDEEEDVEET